MKSEELDEAVIKKKTQHVNRNEDVRPVIYPTSEQSNYYVSSINAKCF